VEQKVMGTYYSAANYFIERSGVVSMSKLVLQNQSFSWGKVVLFWVVIALFLRNSFPLIKLLF